MSTTPSPANRALAEKIADKIMTNGSEQKADRLVLELNSQKWRNMDISELCGWSEKPLANFMAQILQEEEDK